ncbi:MAG TPA: type IV toxin-antitoxin system AbiEi family antitoxin, partial [Blastocatellia bacterium]|nr:type IV toxin-antitoxin system AbiEi family antitoxin [Blastocatellia bacterium]
PIFVESIPEATLRELRVLPDRNGPLILLRAFGTVPFWKEFRRNTIAHPWLIYCELMYSSDPRAHEAAEQLKAEFLSDRAEPG